MSVDILERVRRLIALSESSNLHEARNSAYQACKLIRKHNLRLTQQGLVRVSHMSDIGGDLNNVPWDARRWGVCKSPPGCGYSSGLIVTDDGTWLCISCAREKAVWEANQRG